MAGWNYVPRVGQVYVTTLPSNNAWTQILTEEQAKAARGIKIKSRFVLNQNTPKIFDYAFSETPDESSDVTDGTGYLTNSGSGFGDTFAPTSGIFARTTQSGVIIEVLVYQ